MVGKNLCPDGSKQLLSIFVTRLRIELEIECVSPRLIFVPTKLERYLSSTPEHREPRVAEVLANGEQRDQVIVLQTRTEVGEEGRGGKVVMTPEQAICGDPELGREIHEPAIVLRVDGVNFGRGMRNSALLQSH